MKKLTLGLAFSLPFILGSNTGRLTTLEAAARPVCYQFNQISSDTDGLNIPFASSLPVTILGMGCRDDTTTSPTTPATLTFSTLAGAAITTSTLTCGDNDSAMPFVTTVDTDAALVSGMGVQFDVSNTPNPAVDSYTVCLEVKRTSP